MVTNSNIGAFAPPSDWTKIIDRKVSYELIPINELWIRADENGYGTPYIRYGEFGPDGEAKAPWGWDNNDNLFLNPATWFKEWLSGISENVIGRSYPEHTIEMVTHVASQMDAEIWYIKGNLLADQGKYDEAIQAYDEAIRLYPEYIEAWTNKGMALANQGNHDEAEAAFAQARTLASSPVIYQ